MGKSVNDTNLKAESTAPRTGVRVVTVQISLDVLHVVEEMLRARNRGYDEVLVRLKTWQVDKPVD